MKCPVCKTPDLLMTERRSIEIDYCPACRGVWLDRGELDKLIAEDATLEAEPASVRTRRDSAGHHDDRRRERDHHDDYHDNHRRTGEYRGGQREYKKKRSLFDVFDFD